LKFGLSRNRFMTNMKEDKDWFKEALKFQDENNFSQSLVSIKKYVKQNPKNKLGSLLEAVIYGHLSNYNKVLEILAEIKPIKSDGKNYFKLYYSELGDTYKELGDYKEAIKWYDKVIEVYPNETVGYIFKGSCLASAGKYDLAKPVHLKATEMQGDPEEAFYNLALISRAEMKFEKAKMYCEQSLEIDPDDKSVIHCYEDILEAIKMTKRE